MPKQVKANITLIYGGDKDADIQTNNVPLTLIYESLSNLTKGIAEQLVKEAYGDVSHEDAESYLEGMISLDRLKLAEMLK